MKNIQSKGPIIASSSRTIRDHGRNKKAKSFQGIVECDKKCYISFFLEEHKTLESLPCHIFKYKCLPTPYSFASAPFSTSWVTPTSAGRITLSWSMYPACKDTTRKHFSNTLNQILVTSNCEFSETAKKALQMQLIVVPHASGLVVEKGKKRYSTKK